MALCKLERRNYGGKWPVSIKYQNLHSFKEGLILLCQSILETRRITHLHGSAHFTIPLMFLLELKNCVWFSKYLGFCVFHESQTSKLKTLSWTLLYIRKYIFYCFSWILFSINIKLDVSITYKKHLQLFLSLILKTGA